MLANARVGEGEGIRCMVMRGGTSKGLYFVADDLPADPALRDDLLLRVMGSPDVRQIDGLGGGHPLTSKVAVVDRSGVDGVDVDYHFLQVVVDQAVVTDRQNCGNLLAGVAPFAYERGLAEVALPTAEAARARIRMVNTGGVATATVQMRDGRPLYDGGTAISGVPGTAAPIRLDFEDLAGSSSGALLPTGNLVDKVAGIEATLVDNGMPVVVMRARDLGVTGYESCVELERNGRLRALLEDVRLAAGPLMNLGDVAATTVPKLTLVAAPQGEGSVCSRTFIPHRCHDAIGVLGAVSVATAALLPEGPAAEVAVLDRGRLQSGPVASGSGAGSAGSSGPDAGEPGSRSWASSGPDAGEPGSIVVVEHPTGTFEAAVDLSFPDGVGGIPVVERAGIIRTARKLMDGVVFPRGNSAHE